MLEFLSATVYALCLSVAISLGLGFVYYFVCIGLMSLLRRLFGEDHRGYYLLNAALILWAATFLLLFSFFARWF
jgi:hypothetical protein